MIKLTKLGGETFVLNADLIRYVEAPRHLHHADDRRAAGRLRIDGRSGATGGGLPAGQALGAAAGTEAQSRLTEETRDHSQEREDERRWKNRYNPNPWSHSCPEHGPAWSCGEPSAF